MAVDDRRRIPSTDATLGTPELSAAAEKHGRALVKRVVLHAQGEVRSGLADPDGIVAAVLQRLPATSRSIARVINATGVVVHTNLGRAPLSAAAREAMVEAAGYATVEYELRSGARARRGAHVLDLLCAAVPGAEAALVVNNNAAALALITSAVADDNMIISRGELVEIGDGFRIADILTATGASLREVGATNRTTLADYRAALAERPAVIIKVHQANFTMSGYTGSVGVAELVELGSTVVVDIGSGLLRPHPALPDEPDASTALADGAALVTASADKLLGGPQAGLIIGRADLVERCRRHPLARAMRVDKITLAALEATLRDPAPAPVLVMIMEPYESVRARAGEAAARLATYDIAVDVVDTISLVGGGGAPEVRLPSCAIALPATLAPLLRQGDPPLIGRVEQGRCLLDLRTVSRAEEDELVSVVRQAVEGTPGG